MAIVTNKTLIFTSLKVQKKIASNNKGQANNRVNYDLKAQAI